jgi:4-hydroxybenzoyl-CoA reductase subunit beta
MTLSAVLGIEGPNGSRSVPIDDFWLADGIFNKKLEAGEILTEIRIPPTADGHRGAYGKLRDRGSIDFPLLGVAVRFDLDERGVAKDADVVVTALAARPLRIAKARALLAGARLEGPEADEAFARVAEQAHRQCHPMANIPGDESYRREMVPVYVRRTLRAALDRVGPVHAV